MFQDTEKTVFITGFSPDLRIHVEKTASLKGYRPVALKLEDAEEQIQSVPDLHMLIKISKGSEIPFIRKITTRYPELSLAVCIDYQDRESIHSLIHSRAIPVFFVPIRDLELSQTLKTMEQLRERSYSRSLIASGTKELVWTFSWETANLRISSTARKLAGILADAGFATPGYDEDQVGLAIEEALINAVDHGNLALETPDYSQQDSGESYQKKRLLRLNDSEYAEKRIKAHIETGNSGASVIIEDEGSGFNHKAYTDKLEGDPPAEEELLTLTGKGLYLIGRAFSSVQFNGRGNIITMSRSRKRGRVS